MLLPSEQKLLQIVLGHRDIGVYFSRINNGKFPAYFHNPHGIHGILHAKRVLLLSLALSHLHDLNRADTHILATASLYHDIGRTHDGTCYEHGRHSMQKAVKLGLIDGRVNEENEILRYVVVNHSINDQDTESVENYAVADRERAVRLMKLFKDSDGLDRVRIHDLDVSYLRYPVARELVSFAEYLLREIK